MTPTPFSPVPSQQSLSRPWANYFYPTQGPRRYSPAHLPRHQPKVCWYASAGHDFRPLVFFSEAYRKQHLGHLRIRRPELFIYTCLSGDGAGLKQLATGLTLFEDGRSRITLVQKTPLRIDRSRLSYRIDPDYIYSPEDPLQELDHDAALLEVKVESLTKGTAETFAVLYLAMENINCFEELLSTGLFNVQYLCTTREGVGMGGCKKSVLEHIYAEGRLSPKNFDPPFVITWEDYTDELFRTCARRFHPGLRRVAAYIPERSGALDHHLYQLHRKY